MKKQKKDESPRPSRSGQTPRTGPRKLSRTSNRKYRPGGFQKPDPTVAKARKCLAARFYQMKTGHCLAGQYLAWPGRNLLVVPISHPDPGPPFQTLSRMEEPAKDAMEHGLTRDPQAPRDPRGSGTEPASRNCSLIGGAVRWS